MERACLLFIFLAAVAGVACGGKVLVFPGEFSHWMNMRNIMDELLLQNHSVTVVIPDSSPSVKHWDQELRSKFTFIVFEDPFSQSDVLSLLVSSLHFLIHESYSSSLKTNLQFWWSWIRRTMEFHREACKALTQTSVLERIRAEQPDVVLYDPIVPCGDLVAAVLGVPLVISLRGSPGAVMERLCGQAPLPPSYVPYLPTGDHMTFLERTSNVLVHALSSVLLPVLWYFTMDPVYSEVLGETRASHFCV